MKPNPRIIVPVVLVAAAIVAAVLFAHRGDRDTLTASGTVEATEAQLGFLTAGRIQSVVAHEGDAFPAGAVLAVLDTAEIAAHGRQAAAQLDAARALLDEMQRGSRPEEVQQARAARAAAQQHLDDAQQDFGRAQVLLRTEVVSQQSFDKAKIALDVARSQFQQADEAYRLVEMGPRSERVAGQRAQVANAQAALAAVQAQLSNMTIRAPFPGVVTVRHNEPGEIVAAGSPVVSLMNRDDRWVRIYVSEARIAAVRTGQNATITCDTYRDRTYAGEVTYMSSAAEFTPKNVQTSEERVRLVYAVKVSVRADSSFDLKPGMPADVRLEAKGR
jgi:HlyD family secretion protein